MIVSKGMKKTEGEGGLTGYSTQWKRGEDQGR